MLNSVGVPRCGQNGFSVVGQSRQQIVQRDTKRARQGDRASCHDISANKSMLEGAADQGQ
jgi:hypothetical protein